MYEILQKVVEQKNEKISVYNSNSKTYLDDYNYNMLQNMQNTAY